jgi:hypothetical protein
VSLHVCAGLEKIAVEQRVDLLLHVKYTVKEFDCELTREILKLIAREEDLLRRGRSAESLAGACPCGSVVYLRVCLNCGLLC